METTAQNLDRTGSASPVGGEAAAGLDREEDDLYSFLECPECAHTNIIYFAHFTPRCGCCKYEHGKDVWMSRRQCYVDDEAPEGCDARRPA